MVCDQVEDKGATKHILPLVARLMGQKSEVLGLRGTQHHSSGLQQGCPLSTLLFALTVLDPVKDADAYLKAHQGFAVMAADDLYLVGQPEAVVNTLGTVSEKLRERGYELAEDKCVLYTEDDHVTNWIDARRDSNDHPVLQRNTFKWAANEQGKGFTCVGVPVGEAAYIRQVLDEQVARIHRTLQRVETVLLPVSQQNYYAVLVQSLNKQFGYTLACLPPDQTNDHSRQLDAIMLTSAKKALGITETSLHRWALTRMRLTAKRGGTALVSHAATAPQAHLAMLHRVVPLMVGYTDPHTRTEWTGILPQESADKWQTTQATYALSSITNRFKAVIDNNPAGVGTRIQHLWQSMKEQAEDERTSRGRRWPHFGNTGKYGST